MRLAKAVCIALLISVGLAAVVRADTDEEIAADFEVAEAGSSFVEVNANSDTVNWNELSEEGTLGLDTDEQEEIIADALEMLEIDFINNYGTHEDAEELTTVLNEERQADNSEEEDGSSARFAERRHRGGGGGGRGGGWRAAMANWAAQNARRASQGGGASPQAIAQQSSWAAARRAGQGFFRRLGSGIRRFGERAGQWLRDRFGGTHPVRCRDGTISPSGGHQGACSHHGGIDHGQPPAPAPAPAPPAPPKPAPAPPKPAPPAPAPPKGKKSGWFGRLFNKITAGAIKLGKSVGPKLKSFAKKIGAWGLKKLRQFLKGKKPGTVVTIPPKNGVGPGTKVVVPAKPNGVPLPPPKGAIVGMPVPKTAKQLAEEARQRRIKERRERWEKERAARLAKRTAQREQDQEDLEKWLEEKKKKIEEQEEKAEEAKKNRRKDFSGIRPDLPDSEWRPHTAAECEDCIACRYVWKQVEMDVGNTQIEENVYDSFTANALEAQKTPIFYPGVQSMFDQIDDMLGDYMKGMRVDHMCENAMMCRL